MTQWINAEYRDFHDYPRMMVCTNEDGTFPFLSRFDEAIDDYREYYNAVAGINYDVTTDGQRFLMMKLVEGTSKDKEGTFQQTNLVVVENWFEELKRLAPPEK